MTNAKNTKRALLASILSMMLCMAMLVGSTFAWFTDSVTSGKNKIVAGNLDVELYHTNGNVADEKVSETTPLFTDKDGNTILWEPGVMVYENLTVKNVGTLALKYKLTVNVGNFNTVGGKSLKDVLKVAILDSHFTGDRDAALALDYSSTVADFEKIGAIDAEATDDEYAIVIYWEPGDNDNDYNLNNGKKADDNTDNLFIDLGVNLIATQNTVEKDSFDDQYDKDAWLAMNATDNGNGTYTNDDTLYVKDDGHFVEVTEDTTVGGLYTAVDTGDKYVASVEAFETAAPQGGNVTVMNDIDKVITSTDYIQDPVLNITATDKPANIDLSEKAINIESASGKNGIKVSEGASATFSNGTITMNKGYGTSYGVLDAYHSEITLDNMTVTNSTKDGVCVSAGSDGGKVVIKNSVVSGGNKYSDAVFCGSKSTVVIENSTIVGCIRTMVNGKIELKGGDYTQATLDSQNKTEIIIYSGTFNMNPSASSECKLASGSTVTDNGNGTWTVTAG